MNTATFVLKRYIFFFSKKKKQHLQNTKMYYIITGLNFKFFTIITFGNQNEIRKNYKFKIILS